MSWGKEMKCESTSVRFYISYDIKITLKSHFCRKNVIILSLYTQRIWALLRFPKIDKPLVVLKLSILLHGVISLQGATSYDKV